MPPSLLEAELRGPQGTRSPKTTIPGQGVNHRNNPREGGSRPELKKGSTHYGERRGAILDRPACESPEVGIKQLMFVALPESLVEQEKFYFYLDKMLQEDQVL